MFSKTYDVIMQTPLGGRKGVINLLITQSRLSGYLEILEHSEPFEGTIDEKGNCNIRGKLITPLKIIEYTAIGRITENSLELTLRSNRNVFQITDVSCERSD